MLCRLPRLPVLLESLESRRLLSATLVGVWTSPNPIGGTVLHVTGTDGNDRITVYGSSGKLGVRDEVGDTGAIYANITGVAVSGGGGDDFIEVQYSAGAVPATITGGAGKDTILGGQGNDVLMGGLNIDLIDGRGGTNYMVGGRGNDTLIGIAGQADEMLAGLGNNSYWGSDNGSEIADINATELAEGAWHAVGSFVSYNVPDRFSLSSYTPSMVPRGQNFPDPLVNDGSIAGGVSDVESQPLFGPSGPLPQDVTQQDAGDCFFLASLSAIAAVKPEYLKQMVTNLGDGTYAVRFFGSGGNPVFVRVDGDLATDGFGDPIYANFGADGQSTWAAIIEKAYTEFKDTRGVPAGYEDINGGFVSEAFSDLGAKNLTSPDASNFNTDGSDLISFISNELAQGKAVAYGTNSVTPHDGVPLIPLHAYQVVGIVKDSSGNSVVELRNPWGSDLGNGTTFDGKDDGYVFVSPADMINSMTEIDAGSF